MSAFEQIDPRSLHHAYILEDGPELFHSLLSFVRENVENLEMHTREISLLGIEESRDLARLARMKSQGTQVFVYKIGSATTEAQNALLKLFEEPPQATHFFFCVQGVQALLPTLCSRAWLIKGSQGESDAKVFMQSTPAERLLLLESIIKDRNTGDAKKLLQDIERELYSSYKHEPQARRALQHIIDVRAVLDDKGASYKVLLESVALLTPRV